MLVLYADPVATTCRPVLLFAADARIDLDIAPVDLMAGQNRTEAFARVNPNRTVPVLDHDDFRLTECSAILKYLADLAGSPAYPHQARQRARINQWMDWFVTLFAQDFNYGQVYSRVLPDYALAEPGESERRAWHFARASQRLAVLDAALAESGTFICGKGISLADYLGACFVTLGELIDFDLSPYPNVCRWIAAMKSRPTWAPTHIAFNGWRAAIQAQSREAA